MKRVVLHIGAPKTTGASDRAGAETAKRCPSATSATRRVTSMPTQWRAVSRPGTGCSLRSTCGPRCPFRTSSIPAECSSTRGSSSIRRSTCRFSTRRRWKKFREQVEATGRSLEVAYFVRSITEHAISVYQQLVKRSDYTEGFSTFLRGNYTSPFAETLRRLQNVLPAAAIHVLVYDEVKSSFCSRW